MIYTSLMLKLLSIIKSIDRKRLKKKEEKINTEKRITKRNEKKRKLEEKLIQNTERL